MAQITANVEDLEAKSGQFTKKSEDLRTLVTSTNQMMQELQVTFSGKRAKEIQDLWAGYQKTLGDAVSTLAETGNLLKRAAADFRAADSGR